MRDTIAIEEVLRIIEQSKLHPFSIGFCLPKSGEMVDIKEALSWKYVKGKLEYVLQSERAVRIETQPVTPKNRNLRLIVDLNSGKTYNIFIDLIDRFNNKEVFW